MEADDLEAAEREFSTSIRIGSGLPEVEGMVRLHRAQCRMRMLLERPGADAEAVEDLTIAIRSPAPDVRFMAFMSRCAAYCSMNDPASMMRDCSDAASLLAAHRPMLQPFLPDFERHMAGRGYRRQQQRDSALLMVHLGNMFPKRLIATALQGVPPCGSCEAMCAMIKAGKARLAAQKAQAGQPKNAAIARAKERGGNSYRQGDYAAALEAYSQAINAANAAASSQQAGDGCASNASPSARAILYSNRAATHIKLGAWEAAIQDCGSALALEPGCVKASLRRVHAILQLHESLGLAGSLGDGAQPGRRDWHEDLRGCLRNLATVIGAGDEEAGPEECQKLAQRMLAHTRSIAQAHLHGDAHPPPSSASGAAPAPSHAAGGAEAGAQPSSSSSTSTSTSSARSMWDEAAAGASEAADSGGKPPLVAVGLHLRSMCTHCGKPDCMMPARKLKVCTRCRYTAYCSEACQRAHWPHHKVACKVRAEDHATR